ncbi:MAG: calcium-binding protein [Synechococcaceae cyanobacterium]|nr:calcium-binding protein [Synechococcaceae cyanobacterium]
MLPRRSADRSPTRKAAAAHRRPSAAAFSLVELLVASVVGLLVLVAIGEALIAHLRSSASSEALFRQRQDWARAEHFLEIEIGHSRRISTQLPGSAELAACDLSSDQFRLALEMPGSLPPVIYGVKPRSALGSYGLASDWNGTHVLVRCGPSFDSNGDYVAAADAADALSVVVDELTAGGPGGGFAVLAPAAGSIGRSASFLLSLDGITTPAVRGIGSYLGRSGSSVGLSPPIPFPSSFSNCDQICSGSSCTAPSGISLTQGTAYADVLSGVSSILVCGLGGGDQISGSTADQAIDPGRTASATISGGGGRDVLFGSAGNDSISGGGGDDILVGRNGSDTLVGGGGNDIYYPWTDSLGSGTTTVVRGGGGVDTVYFAGKRSVFTIGSCSTGSCVVSAGSGAATKTVTMENVDMLIFEDDRTEVEP